MSFKEPTFEAVEVGEEFGPIELVVDDHFIKSYAFALDDYHPWYGGDATPFGGRTASQCWVVEELMWLFFTKYDPNAVVGLHQKEEIWNHAPVPYGARLTLTGQYVDKYTRRGKGYVVLDCEARDDQGQLLVRQRSTEIMRIPDGIQLGSGSSEAKGRRVSGVWPEDRQPVAEASAKLTPGTPVQPLVKQVFQDQISVFSGAKQNFRNVHTDIGIARKAGFKDTLAQGLMGTCWLAEMLVNFFGPAWVTSGSCELNYLQPIYPRDTLTCRGVVSGAVEEADGRRLELELWTENQDGTMTSAGWGSARVEG